MGVGMSVAVIPGNRRVIIVPIVNDILFSITDRKHQLRYLGNWLLLCYVPELQRAQ